MRSFPMVCFAFAVMIGSSPAAAQQSNAVSLYDALGIKPPGLRGAELDAAVQRASVHPLGSEKNPVRVKGIEGERRYLSSLRCSNGRKPQVGNRSIGMPSPFGGVTDVYGLSCKGGTPAVASAHLDMYHEQTELRPMPGFTVVLR